MKIIFFGTPEVAVPFLEFLYKNEKVVAVVTQPDKKAGRGVEHLKLSPVKLFAKKKGLPLFQPLKIDELLATRYSLFADYDLGVVVAYGKILPKSLIETARLGYINVHFSLLPKYRGAAPVQWTLINGEKETGVTTFWIDEGLDTGKIICQKKIAIENSDTVITLEKKLTPLGIEILKETIEIVKKNPQVSNLQIGIPSYAPSLKKEDGKINWGDKDAFEICNLIRGTQPWPGAYSTVKSVKCKVKSLKILEAEVVDFNLSPITYHLSPGSIVGLEKSIGFIVKCKNNFLLILKVQEEGKKIVSAWDWWQGARLKIGDCLQ